MKARIYLFVASIISIKETALAITNVADTFYGHGVELSDFCVKLLTLLLLTLIALELRNPHSPDKPNNLISPTTLTTLTNLTNLTNLPNQKQGF